MHTSHFFGVLLVAFLGCGRGEVELPRPAPQTVAPPFAPAPTKRVRLESNFDRSEGFRFSDLTVLTTRWPLSGGDVVKEVRTSDGTLVTGEAARTELQTASSRYFGLIAPGGALCTRSGLGSLAEVDTTTCTGWAQWATLQLSFQTSRLPDPDFVGTGLVVRTDREVYRVWIAQTGFDAVAGVDFVVFDFERRDGPTACSTEGQACVVRNDCCNSRHSCTANGCQY